MESNDSYVKDIEAVLKHAAKLAVKECTHHHAEGDHHHHHHHHRIPEFHMPPNTPSKFQSIMKQAKDKYFNREELPKQCLYGCCTSQEIHIAKQSFTELMKSHKQKKKAETNKSQLHFHHDLNELAHDSNVINMRKSLPQRLMTGRRYADILEAQNKRKRVANARLNSISPEKTRHQKEKDEHLISFDLRPNKLERYQT